MGFTGNLRTLSFGDILQLIATGKKSGMLRLNRPHGAKYIYFRNGDVIAASSDGNTEEERLGQLLIRRGSIKADELERALKRQAANNKRLGHTLIELGMIERSNLVDALRAQVEEVVYSVFSYPDGDFEFIDGESPDPTHILVELNSLSVMMEGARRFDEYMEVAHALPAGETVLRMTPSPHMKDDEITLTAEDVDVLSVINGERSLHEIIASGAHGEYAASKALHKLLQANIVEECPEAAERATRATEERQIYDLVFRLYSHSLSAVRKALTDYLGEHGDRVFFTVPASCADSPQDLVGLLTAASGGTETEFRTAVTQIADPIRLHRVLDLANRVLSEKAAALRDQVSPRIASQVRASIQKDVTFLLAQKRELADRYDIAREFRRALQGA